MKLAKLLPMLLLPATAFAQGGVANLKVVTDANPDYSDMESMVHSITANQKTDADKMWALFYWDHIARRYSWQPMRANGAEVVDPIRQFNDYGYTNFTTIAGIKCSEWNYMGYPCRYFGGVSDVWYDGAFHAYDNLYSCLFSLPDGKTIASVEDIGKTMAGPETNGKAIPGYLAIYHALNGTSPTGYLEGADTDRLLSQVAENYVGYRKNYCRTSYNQERGHRYILNLRPGEIFTRYYHRLDTRTPHAVVWDQNNLPWYKSDTAYFVPNGQDSLGNPSDPEMLTAGDRIRGNGERAFTPPLDEAHLAQSLYSSTNIKPAAQGLTPANPAQPASAIFKVEGANVITSIKVRALFTLATKTDSATLSFSTTNGSQWTDFWNSEAEGDSLADLRLIDQVSGAYDVLIKVTLKSGSGAVENALLKSISFDTITQLNSKTQPQLHIGANTVYVGAGEQTDSIVLWPNLRDPKDPRISEAQNIRFSRSDLSYQGFGFASPEKAESAWLVFKVDAPTDITGFTYGGRLSNRSPKSRIEFLHSLDGGKTWQKDYSLADASLPSDVIHFESLRDIPAGHNSILFKYALDPGDNRDNCSLYSVHMEVNHKLNIAPGLPGVTPPLEVTFKWRERQQNYQLTSRSHTQLVEKLPFTYQIDVNGADHPIVDSLIINYKGARSDVNYGYGDANPAATNPASAPATQPAQKWIGAWATYGNNLALHKPYTVSKPSGDFWGSGDPHLKKLTDGVVASSFSMGPRFPPSAAWASNANPEITVDLGSHQKCAAFRIHTLGWEPWDAIKGQNKDKIELLTSTDGQSFTSHGFFNCNLRWKDLPVNFMFPDDETLGGYNFTLAPSAPVEARYVKYKITTPRIIGVTEVQVLDAYELKPYDLNIALPDPAQNGKPAPKPDLSPNSRKWADNEKCTAIGK